MSKKKTEPKSVPTLKKGTPQYMERNDIPKGGKTEKRAILPKMPSFDWSNHRLPLLIVGVLAFGLYAASLGFGYALDDTMVIEKNQFVQKGFDGIGDIFRFESFRGYFGEQKQLLEGDRYRPFSLATFAGEIGLFGKANTFMGHFFNLLLYVLTAILLYRVLLFMFPKDENIAEEDAPSNFKLQTLFSVPFLATALFIAHPLHVEVVANIKGRDEILALIGELSALYFMFKWTKENNLKYLIALFLTILIAMLSKESAITFLAIIPLTAHFFTKATNFEKIKVTIPVFAAMLFYLMMRVNAIGYLLDGKVVTDLMNNPFYGMTTGDRLATISYTLLLYLKLHIFPHPLTHDYYPFQIPRLTWSDWRALLGLGLHIGLVAVIVKGWKNRTIWSYAAAFYLITLSIVSNVVVSVGTFMNERFVYHASIAFCIAAAYFLTRKFMPKMATIGVAAALILAFSAKTISRVPDWKSGATLNASAIINSPNSARSNCFFAVSLWEEKFLKLPKDATNAQKSAILTEMKPYFEKSLSIIPNYGSALKMWVGIAAEEHKIDGDLDKLLAAFERMNRSLVYEPFILQYLGYASGRISTRVEGDKLMNFYTTQQAFFKEKMPNSIMPSEYQKLIDGLNPRLVLLK
jgi:protein O-mannosyl-transferase